MALTDNKKLLIAGILTTGIIAGGIYWWTSSAPKKIQKPEKPKTKEKKKTVQKEKSIKKDQAKENINPNVKIVEETISKLNDDAQNARLQGNKCYGLGRINDAIEHYTESIRLYDDENPDKALAYSNRALCYFKQERYLNVIEDCTKALEINPNYVKALDKRSKAYEVLSMREEAAVDVLAAFYISKMNDQRYMNKADDLINFLANEKLEGTYKDFENVLPSIIVLEEKINCFGDKIPKFPKIEAAVTGDEFFKNASYFINEKNYQRAWEYLCLADKEKLDEHQGLFHSIMSTFYFAMCDVQKTLYHIELGINKEPRNAMLLAKRATIKMEMGMPQEGLESFEEAEKVDPQNPFVFLNKCYYLSMSSAFIGYDDAQKCVLLGSEFPIAFVNLSRFYLSMGNKSKALETINLGLEKHSSDPHLINIYIDLLSDDERKDKQDYVSSLIDKMLELNPKNAVAYLVAGGNLMLQKKYAEALEMLDKAEELDPAYSFTYFAKAHVNILTNNLNKAKEHIKKAIENTTNQMELIQVIRQAVEIEIQIKVIEKFPQLLNLIESQITARNANSS